MGLRCLLSVVAVLVAVSVRAQESLDTILDRGYIAQWLVCGPFEPDAEGGILGAVKAGRPPLGSKDFMEPLGGVARIRPQHLTKVEGEKGVALWQLAGVQDSSLDLAPFFPDRNEGVSYAAFYVQSDVDERVYMDLQTPLGARVFLNGFLIREIRAAPLSVTGVDRFLVTFRRGLNLFVMEVPGATYESLGRATGMASGEIRESAFINRALLQGKSGFEIALDIMPTRDFGRSGGLGGLVFVPRLRSSGTFSGRVNNIRQDVVLTLFNPQTFSSPAIGVKVNVVGGGSPLELTIPPIPAQSPKQTSLPIPTAGAGPGETLSLEVELSAGDERVRFAASITVLRPSAGGNVYFVTGARVQGVELEDQATEIERHLSQFARQLLLMGKEGDYGFDLGGTSLWKPAFDMHPAGRRKLLDAVAFSRVAAWAGYGVPDERMVSGELLVRNLLHGYGSAKALLGDWNPVYFAWDSPAVAPQTPQILANAGVLGVVSNLPYRGLAELFRHEALDGTRVLHRRKQPGAAAPRSGRALRMMAERQRQELLERGLESDILVNTSEVAPPEPFWLEDSASLARSVPAIKVRGGGGRDFFEDAHSALLRASDDLSVSARTLTTHQLGALVAQPGLKSAYTQTESLVLRAEKFATMAALLGANYPEDALDLGWRQLLFCSSSRRLGFARTTRVYVDALAACREAAEYARGVLDDATDYIARLVDTYGEAPAGTDDALAVVVFNPSSWPRTDLCEMDLTLDGAAGLTLIDKDGVRVPFSADRLRIVNGRIAGARLRFMATRVPPLGYKTYYLVPSGELPKPVVGKGAQIENDFFRIIIDPSRGGGIAGLTDKKTGKEFVEDLWDEVLALPEDRRNNDKGRDLWTDGPAIRASDHDAAIELTRGDWYERLTLAAPFLGGRVVREITLYQGLPQVMCETRFEGLTEIDHLLAVTFSLAGAGQVPVFGERFGALVGRRSPMPMTFRTRGIENPSGTGAQPAFRWSALSPNDHIRVGADMAVPFGPAAVVHGDGGLLRGTAGEIQRALTGRGIPVDVWPSATRRLSLSWTDSTEFPNHNDDLNHGTAFRIVLGSPEQNRFTRLLFRQLSEDTITEFTERMMDGGALFFLDEDVPEDRAPVPTLILAGLTAGRTAEVGRDFARSVAEDGIYHLPPRDYVPQEGQGQPNQGLAILHKGAALSSVEGDGRLVILLSHAGRWDKDDDDLDIPVFAPNQSFRYALYPFFGTWRGAGVAQAGHAYNEPFSATVTDLHLGPHPPEQSLLGVNPRDFIVTSVKPAGNRVVSMGLNRIHPREGMIVRGYESAGRPWEGRLTFFAGVVAAALANGLDAPGASLRTNEGEVQFSASGFDITSLWVQPSARIRGGLEAQLGRAVDPYGPVFTRYWRHNRGAAPLGFQPLTLLLEGRLDDDTGAIDLVVANNLSDDAIQGEAFLTATSGWKIGPKQFAYSLGAGEFVKHEVVVLREEASAATGGIVARTEFAGRTYQDILGVDEDPIGLDVTRSGDEVRVTVTNRGGLPAEGFVDLIVPPAHWPEFGPRPAAVAYPRRAAVFVAPFESQFILFRSSGDHPGFWMVVKLAANGQVRYVRGPE